jgi:hypothetical protein
MKCIKCKKREVFIKKRGLCRQCYMKEYYANKIKIEKGSSSVHPAEMEFIKNFFPHNDWIYLPVVFHLEKTSYTPDFYDVEQNTFIEVVGTPAAYHANKEKYQEMKTRFPKIRFEIRAPDGKLINESNMIFKRSKYPKII